MKFQKLLTISLLASALSVSAQSGGTFNAPKDFAFVPAGSSVIRGQEITLQAFYMYKQEVTNGEYKQFLNDLKKKNDTILLKTARIQSEKWIELGIANGERYADMDEFPVVCISKTAANLYCKWLEKKLKEDNKDYADLTIRLPLRDEWEYAAQNGQKFAEYPWVGRSVKNDQGQYLAHFKVVGQLLGPMKVRSFPPSEFKLYDLAGNVSEMVGDLNVVMGGSWNSQASEIKVSWEDPDDVSPTVGFRPVFSYIRK